MNKISKLGKSILEIALKEMGEYTNVISVSHQFDFLRTCNESIAEEVFGGLKPNEQISFMYWEPLMGLKRLSIGYGEIFINAFAETEISTCNWPTHFIIEKHRYCGTEFHEIVESDYVVHYIEIPRRQEIIDLKFKMI